MGGPFDSGCGPFTAADRVRRLARQHAAPLRPVGYGRSGTLRAGLRQSARWEPVDIDEMKRVVAEELARVLTGTQGASGATAPTEEDIEGRYGAKLDRLLGGLAAGSGFPKNED